MTMPSTLPSTLPAAAQYSVPWNGGTQTLAISRERVRAELRYHDYPALPDPAAAIVRALESPIGAPPLRSLARAGTKVAVAVGDRMTDWMLGARGKLGLALLDYLNGLGVRDEDVPVIYACGMHARGHAPERMGADLLGRARFIAHDATDDSQLKFVGNTSRGTPVMVNRAMADADVRIGFGEVSPVGPAGWCGGGKIILPGVAGRDTIEHNHRMVISPFVRLGAIDRNPVRLDIEEAAALAGLQLKVDVLVNSSEEIVAVYAGDFRLEWRSAIAMAKDIWTTPMEPTDIAVLYPGETRERHLANPIYLTIPIGDAMTRPGGAIILTLSAAGGWSPWERDEHGPSAEMFALSSVEIARRMVRAQGNVRSLHIAYMAKVIAERKPVYVHCDGFTAAEARSLGFASAGNSLDDLIAQASARTGGRDASISVGIPRGIQWRMMPRVDD